MDLPADILEAAHDDGGAVLPQEEHVVLPEGLKDEFLKGLIVKGVVGEILYRQHRGSHQPSLGKIEQKYYTFFAGDCQQKGNASGCLSGKEMV